MIRNLILYYITFIFYYYYYILFLLYFYHNDIDKRIKDIVKNTWEEHRDYQGLKQSEEMVLELADRIDIMLEEFKSLEKLMKLHKNIVFKKNEVPFPLLFFFFSIKLFFIDLL